MGAVTDSSAAFSVRTDQAASVAIQYSTDSLFATFGSSDTRATSDTTDFTAILRVPDGLARQTLYYYRVVLDGVPAAASAGSFTTFPRAGSGGPIRFAVVTDLENTKAHPTLPAPVYATVRAQAPAFVLQIGDFDHRNPTALAAMRLMPAR